MNRRRNSSVRPRVVFDCNTLIQAIAFNGPAAQCLAEVEAGRVELFISRSVLAEVRRVLAYPDIVAISPSMTPERIGAFLQRLRFRGTFIRNIPHAMDYPRDPADEPYINLAIAVEADYLVTRDKDLLSLMTSHLTICRQFRRLAPSLRIIAPGVFLDALVQPRDK